MPFLPVISILMVPLLGLTDTTYIERASQGGEKPSITEISDDLWRPSPPGSHTKVIYGDDDRKDVYQETNAERLAWAASTCALVYTSRLTQHSDGSYTISSPSAYRRFGLPPCAGEPFGDQPVASYCSAFVVGPDLIVTAGHCYSSASFTNTRFIFGFHMIDEDTPRLEFDANQVYQGVEIVSYSPSGNDDHCLVRVDRLIQAPDARPFPLRRAGVIQPGEYVGVIGHPSGLPMKLAFGNTYVRSSTDSGFFVANLDTYGGNSGSPVINATTGTLEGILVRGETDFINRGACFVSNTVANDSGRGEDVTKPAVFADFVPTENAHSGVITLDAAYFGCGASVTVTVIDLDLAGMELLAISLETSNGDKETIALAEIAGQPGKFSGVIATHSGLPLSGSSILEVSHGDIVIAIYNDEEDESGASTRVEAAAEMDCFPPLIYDVTVSFTGATQAQIQFKTDESSQGLLRYGIACQNLTFMATGQISANHAIPLSGLTPDTRYYFAVEAQDRAGNSSTEDNGGSCYSLLTYNAQNHFTEYFNAQNEVDIEYSQATYIPVDGPNHYQACSRVVEKLPVPATEQILTLADDGFHEVRLPEGKTLSFYGITYDRFFIGSNGYITFGSGDSTYQALPSQHFLLPRISAVMCDLNPTVRGTVHVTGLSDRYVTTFSNVPVYDGTNAYPPENSHTFQIELFFNGIIRITWLEITATRIMAGLSAGLGVPANFSSIKISQYRSCSDIVHEGRPHSADVNQDWHISLEELLHVIQFYNSNGYSCDPLAIDGYRAGAGPRDCVPHNSDYFDQDWRISISELLRLIQLYNASSYRPQADSEDGFQVIP